MKFVNNGVFEFTRTPVDVCGILEPANDRAAMLGVEYGAPEQLTAYIVERHGL